MGQINLGAMLINHQVSSTEYSKSKSSSISNTYKKDTNGFGKELDRAKTTQTLNKKDQSSSTANINENSSIQKDTEIDNKEIDNKENDTVEKLDGQEKDELVIKEENIEDKLDNQALALLSQLFSVPVEQVKEILTKMGCTPQDLLSTDTLNSFMSELYQTSDVSELLLKEGGIKNINKFLEQLAEVYNDINISSDETSPMLPVEKIVTKQSIVEPNAEPTITEVVPNVNEEQVKTISESIEHLLVQEGITNQGKPSQVAEINNRFEVVGQEAVNELSAEPDLGIVVPITQFSSTEDIKMWQFESSLLNTANATEEIEQPIIDQIDYKQLADSKEIQLQLSPRELGKLSIKLVQMNGNLVADIKVESEKTKSFILSEVNQLKSALEEQGLNVAEVKVDIRQNTHQSQMEQEKQKSSRRIQEIIGKQLNDIEELESDSKISPQDVGESQVDYMV